MKLDFSALQYNFRHKPLLIAGRAMEYYGLRKAGAAEEENCLVVSPEKLLFLKAPAMEVPKHHRDLELIVKKVPDDACREKV